MKTFFLIVATVIGTIGAVIGIAYLGLFALFDGLSTSRIVMIVLGGILALLAGALLVMWLTGRMWRVRMGQGSTETAIDGKYHMLDDYRAPQAALPAPRVIQVPRYQVNNVAQPYGMPAQPIPILRTVSDDVEMTVPLNYLQRFLGLSTPARSEWVGKREMYSACLAFAEAHGLLDRDARGGAIWRPAYPLEARRAWSEQFESTVTKGQGQVTR